MTLSPLTFLSTIARHNFVEITGIRVKYFLMNMLLSDVGTHKNMWVYSNSKYALLVTSEHYFWNIDDAVTKSNTTSYCMQLCFFAI